ncbi:MAG: helix-turn-helix transcriptional regulator [Candidatus Woesearchaeota archaeon]
MRWILLFLLLMVPVVSANTATIDIELTNNDLTIINYYFVFNVTEEYDSFQYQTIKRPLVIDYEGEYRLFYDEVYTIVFYQIINSSNNIAEYSLIYEDFIDDNRNNKVFRTNFVLEEFEKVNIYLTLPEQSILSETPNVIPEVTSLETDGRQITLSWEFEGDDNKALAVFYQSPRTNFLTVLIIGFVLLIFIVVMTYYFLNKKMRDAIKDTLTEDEKLIIEEIRKGVEKQKDIARNLEFSKSKMSKVVRKLEEKDLLIKEPYFKTNKLKIKKIN